jgi:hypothetical protein
VKKSLNITYFWAFKTVSKVYKYLIMNKIKWFRGLGISAVTAVGLLLIAGDHIDGPSVAGTTSDIARFYAFEGENTSNLVLVANLQGMLPAGTATENAKFDEDVLVEFNIDTTGDMIEDLVIQAIRRADTMYFFGPAVPFSTGTSSEIMTFATRNQVQISSGEADSEAIVAENNGMKFFAGPRDDSFFFDLDRYEMIVNQEVTGFNEEGEDKFAGMNVLSIVVELPKSLLGAGTVGVNPYAPDVPMYSMWVETKRKQ